MIIFKRLKKIGCGCLLIIIILLALGAAFSGIIIKKLISGTITQKTGVVQTTVGASGGTTFTDPKTGAVINLDVNRIPDNFPKDFPIYTNAKVSSSYTAPNGEKGIWLTLTTTDSPDKVVSFYNEKLKENGWSQTSSTDPSDGTIFTLSKDKLAGSLLVQKAKDQNETSIIVVLAE
ncbi:MAG TPA: hypothetical protein VLE44_00285, partial [Candidatus Saccharimonadales bacterium]|nr:hypothetical protein [Candidatus Saccharimonadales bacterium]